jgi:hypothetical protein
MGVLGSKLPYADTLAAIGRMAAKKQLNDLCVMEFEEGVIVTGSVLYEAGESYNRRIETLVLSVDDIKRLIKEA